MNDPSDEAAMRREQVLLQRTVDELMRKFGSKLPGDVIESCLYEAYESVSQAAKVRMYVVATAGRLARDRLKVLAREADAALQAASSMPTQGAGPKTAPAGAQAAGPRAQGAQAEAGRRAPAGMPAWPVASEPALAGPVPED